MTIDDIHKSIIISKILECKNNTSYTDEQLSNMSDNALFILDIIIDINKKIVKVKNIKDEDIDLTININNLKFCHNMLLIYASHNVLEYLKFYIKDKIYEYDIRITGNGYGNAIVIHY